MTDAASEAEDLFQDFLNRMEVLKDTFQIQLTALAWKLAAEVVAQLPDKFAVGSLTWKGKGQLAKKASVVIPVTRTQQPAPNHVSAPKIVILGPKPKERAERYQALLDKRSGQWSRRDGKVMYTVCDTKVTHSVSKAFYKMRRLDNGVEKWIKFVSIVSDWKYFDA